LLLLQELSLTYDTVFVASICGKFSAVGAGDAKDAIASPRNFFGGRGKSDIKIWENLIRFGQNQNLASRAVL